MRDRLLAVVVGLGLVVSVLGTGPTSAAPTQKRKLPDLVVRAVSVAPSSVAPGGVLRVRDTTRNKGRRVAKRSSTRYVLSRNKRLDRADVRLGDRRVRRLKAGKRHRSPVRRVRVPTGTRPGRYWLLACADARRQVRESVERNNCRAARKRVVVAAKKPPAWPRDGYVQVAVSARIDTRYRSESNDPPFTRSESQDVGLEGDGTGWLLFSDGRPEDLSWTWSRAVASGSGSIAATGMSYEGCPWEASANLSTGGVLLDVHPHGGHTGAAVTFPAADDGPDAWFELEKVLDTTTVPRTDCEGPDGVLSPDFRLELRDHWWSGRPTVSVSWERDLSTVRWKLEDSRSYTAPGGGTEISSYESTATLRLARVR